QLPLRRVCVLVGLALRALHLKLVFFFVALALDERPLKLLCFFVALALDERSLDRVLFLVALALDRCRRRAGRRRADGLRRHHTVRAALGCLLKAVGRMADLDAAFGRRARDRAGTLLNDMREL